MDPVSLPLIDLSSPMETKAAAIERACRDNGFFYVTGHGVPPALIARMDAAAGSSSPFLRRSRWRSRWRTAAGPGAGSSRSAPS
jgi:isopenicillin N synthase-like dioxygenase